MAGNLPSGCTQRDIDMAAPGYWDDPYYFDPECKHCDDAGCLECCPEEPVTLDDLDQIDSEIFPVLEQSELAGQQQLRPASLALMPCAPNSEFDSRDGGHR